MHIPKAAVRRPQEKKIKKKIRDYPSMQQVYSSISRQLPLPIALLNADQEQKLGAYLIHSFNL